MTTSLWADHDRWNEAIFDHYFHPRFARMPIYLDLDDDTLDEIGEEAGFSLVDGPMSDQFLDAMQGTFRLSDNFLNAHTRRASGWERDLLAKKPGYEATIPPFIALLGFFSYVAFSMQNSGGFSSANYHDRLADAVYGGVLDSYRKTRLGNDFRNYIVRFYDSLAYWLDFEKSGSFGVSTADPGPFHSRRFIGYPISQAIMRRDDRAKLPHCFRFGRLSPNDKISLDDMVTLLEQWLPMSGLNLVVITTFAKGDGERKAVAQIALAELMAWTGDEDAYLADDDDDNVNSQNLIIVFEKKSFPRPQVSLIVGFINRDGASERRFKISRTSQPIFDETSGAEFDELTFEQTDPGLWLSRDKISMSDFLITQVQLASYDGMRRMNWQLSRTVVFESNSELDRLISTTSPSIGKSLSILTHVQEVDRIMSLIDQAKVNEIAYRRINHQDMDGIPQSWVLLEGVVLGSNVLGAVDSGPQINLEGGVKVPGEPYWLASRIPKVTFMSTAAVGESQLTLVENQPFSDRPSTPRRLLVSDGGGPAKSADLSDGPLPVGFYKLTLTTSTQSKALNYSMRFGICSADQPKPNTRGLVVDQNLVEDPLHPPLSDMPYSGGMLTGIPIPDSSDLPPTDFKVGPAEEEVPTEYQQLKIWGAPLPPPEIHLKLEKGNRVLHDEFGEGEVTDIDENKLGVTIDFGPPQGIRWVTSGVSKILPPALHLKMREGHRVLHDKFGEGTVMEIDADRVTIGIFFETSSGRRRITQGISKILPPEIHFNLRKGDRVLHRSHGLGEVIEFDENRVWVTIRFPRSGERRFDHGILKILPPELHFKLSAGDNVLHDEFGEGNVIEINQDKSEIRIDFGPPKSGRWVANGIIKVLPPAIHLKLRIDDRVQHVHGEGTVVGLDEDRVGVSIKFGSSKRGRRVTNGLIKILEIAYSTLDLGDRVEHTRYGVGTVTEVYEDGLTVEMEFGSGGAKRRISNGLFEKLSAPETEPRLGSVVRHREHGEGQVIGFQGRLTTVRFFNAGTLSVPPELLKILVS